MASVKEKIAYALGDAAAGGIVWKVMSIAFPLFFTNVFGLTFADAAVLMLVARMFDVVTDPLMGSLADRTQSRWGTYRRSHTFRSYFCPVALYSRLRSDGQASICLYFIFAHDGSLHDGQCALWLTAWCDDRR